MDNNWIYYAAVVEENDKKRLLDIAKKNIGEIPNDWKIYCHHMTFVYNDQSPERQKFAEEIDKMLGTKCLLYIDSIGVSDRAIAFGVGNVKTQNEHSHITVAVAPGAKPVESNNIINWKEIGGFFVRATVGVFKR